MRKSVGLAFLILITHTLFAQDEGTIVKRERIDKNHGVFLALGPSFTLGKNIGDYSTGLNIEAGFMKRLNRILSMGPSLSYIKFKYDPSFVKSENADDLYVGKVDDVNGWTEYYGLPDNQQFTIGYFLKLNGGDISLTSLAWNIKLNLIPITDRSRFSVYGFAKPFVSYSQRSAVTGKGERAVYQQYVGTDDYLYTTTDNLYYYDDYDEAWGPSSQFPALKKESKVTGGIFVGPGVEFNPAKTISIFGQAAFGYTFPISYVSTKSYPQTLASYTNKDFPIVEKGFPSISIQVGATYNF